MGSDRSNFSLGGPQGGGVRSGYSIKKWESFEAF